LKSVDTKVVEELTTYNSCKGWQGFYGSVRLGTSCQDEDFLGAVNGQFSALTEFLEVFLSKFELPT
jgi:hypothetical protein